jgi:hypothetical protein
MHRVGCRPSTVCASARRHIFEYEEGPGLVRPRPPFLPLFTKCLEGVFCELRPKGVGLLLDHRLCWLSRGYGVSVSMHYLPSTIL